MNTSTSAVGYVRVSTGKQGNSVEAQEVSIRAQASQKGLPLTEVIIDDSEFSGDLDRPGVIRLMQLINARKIGSVIITKLDRLTRSTRDAISLMEMLQKKEVALISIHESLDTETSHGRFFMKMMASFAELEREQIGERTSAVMQSLKSRGLPAGTAPFGWENVNEHDGDGNLIRRPLRPVETEQNAIARMTELRGSGLSTIKIAGIMNEEGFTTRAGTPWVQQYVSRVLKAAK